MHLDFKNEMARSKGARIGMVFLLFVLFMGIFAPLFATQNPLMQSTHIFEKPSLLHPLGTNHTGQDIWSQLLYGARTSLVVGFTVAVLSTLLSSIIGASAALFGGIYDRIVMRIVDAFIVMPMILVLLLLSVYIDPKLDGKVLMGLEILFLVMAVVTCFYVVRMAGWPGFVIVLPIMVLGLLSQDLLPRLGGLIFVLSLLSWQGGARIIRSQALSLKEKAHISAAGGFGAGTWYILCRHIIPDLGPILVADFIFCVRRGVFLQAGLAFLGLGDPGTVSWGAMISDARDWIFMAVWKWWLLPPGVALSITIVAITLIGRSLEPVLDPRLRGEINAQN